MILAVSLAFDEFNWLMRGHYVSISALIGPSIQSKRESETEKKAREKQKQRWMVVEKTE